MIRIVFEFSVIVAAAALLLYGARQFGSRPRSPLTAAGPSAAPSDAVWQAGHHGTAEDRTAVVVELRRPGSDQVWDRRTCAEIDNRDPDYDRQLYNAIEDARARAMLLNSLREG